ncbi:hypothetical protein [Saccharopolyspora tripterygii]
MSAVDRVAAAVLEHPAVAGLHGGNFGDITTYLPGRRVAGVRLADADAAATVGVVLRLGDPLPEIVEQLRSRVVAVLGDVPVDVEVCGVVAPGEDAPGEGAAGAGGA